MEFVEEIQCVRDGAEIEEAEMVEAVVAGVVVAGADGWAVAAEADARLGDEEGLEAVEGGGEGVLGIGQDDAGVRRWGLGGNGRVALRG